MTKVPEPWLDRNATINNGNASFVALTIAARLDTQRGGPFALPRPQWKRKYFVMGKYTVN